MSTQPEPQYLSNSLPYKSTKRKDITKQQRQANNFNTVRNEVDVNENPTPPPSENRFREVCVPGSYPIPTPVDISALCIPLLSSPKVISHLPLTTTTRCLFFRCPRREGGGSPHLGKRKSLKKAWKKRSMFVTRLLSSTPLI